MQIEWEKGGAIQERAEYVGNRAAELAGLQQSQSIRARNPQRVRVAHDVVKHVSVIVENAFRAPG